MNKINDISLAPSGHKKIDWVSKNMPILNEIKKDFEKNQYFKNLNITMSIHLEAKTAYLATILMAGGANVAVTGCNPLSTQDDVAAALAERGLHVYGWHGASQKEYHEHLLEALQFEPSIFIDDGGDLTQILHNELKDMKVWGGSEETTTGVHRLNARSSAGLLRFPMISVNDAFCKYLFDNRYGTGQSVWNAINKTTNLIAAGKQVVIAGYGWCGKGCAMRAKGLGANVIVCEVDPIRAIEAVMDGFRVMPMDEAAKEGDIFITVTGCKDVITKKHYDYMKNGAVLCNAGHFDVEVKIPDLEEKAAQIFEARENIMSYQMKDGRVLNVLAQGRLVNLAAGDGHPAEIMDMSFALQALTAKYLVQSHEKLVNKVYPVPEEIDSYVAKIKLQSMGMKIDELTALQKEYLYDWGE